MSVEFELDEQSPIFRETAGLRDRGQQMLNLDSEALCLAANRA